MFYRTLNSIDWLITKITFIFAVIGGCLTVMMIFTTTYGVAMRYFFREPVPVSYELTTIFMLWAFLFAISYVEFRDEHIKADIFVSLMPGWLVNSLQRIVGPTLAMVYCFILMWKGWSVALYSFMVDERSMSVWGEPLFPVKIVVPICYGLLFLVVLRNLVRGIGKYAPPDCHEQPA